MHPRNWFYLALSAPGLLFSANTLAHPGHQHEPGLLAGLNHAVIGWNQLLILFLIGGVLVYYVKRRGK